MLKKKIWGFIRLLRPEISIFGMLCVYIGAIASGSYLFSYELVYGMLAVFLLVREVCLSMIILTGKLIN